MPGFPDPARSAMIGFMGNSATQTFIRSSRRASVAIVAGLVLLGGVGLYSGFALAQTPDADDFAHFAYDSSAPLNIEAGLGQGPGWRDD